MMRSINDEETEVLSETFMEDFFPERTSHIFHTEIFEYYNTARLGMIETINYVPSTKYFSINALVNING